jgi:hypothetical protein
MAERDPILRSVERVPLSSMMDSEIVSQINRVLFHQEAPAHIRIVNVRRNTMQAIKAITHENLTLQMALSYLDNIITAVKTVHKGVINHEENESWERRMIHSLPFLGYLGNGSHGLPKMYE